MIQITLGDTGLKQALHGVLMALDRPEPALKAMGELVLEFTKQRFELSQDPYGVPWEKNRPSTLAALLGSHPKNRTSKGKVSKRGARLLAGKKPLIGKSKSLSKTFRWKVIGQAVEIRSIMKYSAMQQFGGKRADFPHLWGDIPARPFFLDASRGLPSPLKRAWSEFFRRLFLAFLGDFTCPYSVSPGVTSLQNAFHQASRYSSFSLIYRAIPL